MNVSSMISPVVFYVAAVVGAAVLAYVAGRWGGKRTRVWQDSEDRAKLLADVEMFKDAANNPRHDAAKLSQIVQEQRNDIECWGHQYASLEHDRNNLLNDRNNLLNEVQQLNDRNADIANDLGHWKAMYHSAESENREMRNKIDGQASLASALTDITLEKAAKWDKIMLNGDKVMLIDHVSWEIDIVPECVNAAKDHPRFMEAVKAYKAWKKLDPNTREPIAYVVARVLNPNQWYVFPDKASADKTKADTEAWNKWWREHIDGSNNHKVKAETVVNMQHDDKPTGITGPHWSYPNDGTAQAN